MAAIVRRRALLGGGIGVAAAAALPSAVWGQVRNGETGDATPRQRVILSLVSDIVIPPTATPGASAVGVPAFVELALAHGLDASRTDTGYPGKQGGTELLAWLQMQLDARCDRDFIKAAPAARLAAVTVIDSAAFAEPPEAAAPWRKIKDLILTAYYTSEVGASRELRFTALPGRYDPDLPLKPGEDISWSSDWTALDFG